jgi:hypothetical protein
MNEGKRKNILIVELNHYHHVVFPMYSEMLPALFPKTKINLFYLVHPNNFEQLVPYYKNIYQIGSSFVMKLMKHLQLLPFFNYFKIQKLIKRNDIDFVFFNTIEPKRVYKVFKKIKTPRASIVHEFGQQIEIIPSENEYYFCLADYVFEHFKSKNVLSGYIFPFFTNFKQSPKKEIQNDKIIIGIQGHIDFKKRDFQLIIDMAKKLKEINNTNILFNIVGSIEGAGEGHKLKTLIEENELGEYFILHPRLDDDQFHEQFELCTIIMPLINIEQSCFLEEKMTSAYILAAAFKTPMLIKEKVAKTWHIKNAITYNEEDLFEKLLDMKQDYVNSFISRFEQEVDSKLNTNKQILEKIIKD